MNLSAKKVLLLGLVPAAAVAVVMFFCDPVKVPIYPVCLFHRWTGLDCPGCGGLRAAHALLHGRIVDAMHFNLLLVLSLPLFAWLGGRYVFLKWHQRPVPSIRLPWLWTYASLWIVFGIVRNLPVPWLAAFAP